MTMFYEHLYCHIWKRRRLPFTSSFLFSLFVENYRSAQCDFRYDYACGYHQVATNRSGGPRWLRQTDDRHSPHYINLVKSRAELSKGIRAFSVYAVYGYVDGGYFTPLFIYK